MGVNTSTMKLTLRTSPDTRYEVVITMSPRPYCTLLLEIFSSLDVIETTRL